MTIDINSVLGNAQKEADAARAAQGAGKGDWINTQRLPKGKHKVRIFADPEGRMFHDWRTMYVSRELRKQADPRHFDECDAELKARLDAVVKHRTEKVVKDEDGKEKTKKLPTLPWKKNFWDNVCFYAYVYETNVKDKWYTPGKMYVLEGKYTIRDAVLKALAKFAEKFPEDMSKSIDVNEAGWGLEIEITDKATTVFPDVHGEELASPVEQVKMAQFVPLAQLYSYDAAAAEVIVDLFERNLKEAMSGSKDKAAAQTPPAEDEPATEAPAETQPADEEVTKEEKPAAPAVEDDDDPF